MRPFLKKYNRRARQVKDDQRTVSVEASRVPFSDAERAAYVAYGPKAAGPKATSAAALTSAFRRASSALLSPGPAAEAAEAAGTAMHGAARSEVGGGSSAEFVCLFMLGLPSGTCWGYAC